MSDQPPSEPSGFDPVPPAAAWDQPPPRQAPPDQPSPPGQSGQPSQPDAWPAAPAQPQAGYVFQLADIGVTSDTIVTTSGTAPLAGSTWLGLDYSRTESKIPTWAIVLAIVFAVFCLLGLLFLLVKEDQTTGFVEVRVQSGQFWHISHIPVTSRIQVDQIIMQVSQAQAFAHRQSPHA